jgi:hypothetical protein
VPLVKDCSDYYKKNRVESRIQKNGKILTSQKAIARIQRREVSLVVVTCKMLPK